ncbi:hypothetical protein GCM10020331_050120 [Ectobacillus funiculus]
MALAAIILQANQNMQHGGQSFAMFDRDLAPYVRKTYERHVERLGSYARFGVEEIQQIAWEETKQETYQACEAFIHNANSMHSRGGGDKCRLCPSIMGRIRRKKGGCSSVSCF